MTNEEKIISMLGKMQADIEELKARANFQIDNETPEQYEARKKSLLEFIDRPLTPEEKQEAEEFAEIVETPEEKKLRQIAAFRNFVNSKTDEEEPDATAEFFRIMDAEEARKAAV